MGHIHLHVRDVAEAEAFYTGLVGFDRMVALAGSATFLSAGGYHHHLGANEWNGRGAAAPPEDAVGLRWYTIHLPTEGSKDIVLARLNEAGVKSEERDGAVFFRDPSHNGVMLKVGPDA
jgi:catechol 2,3-dioxygenase